MNTEPTHTPRGSEPVVFADGSIVRANSLDVAGYFEKRHDNVMRDIRALIDAAEGDHALKIEEMFRPAARHVVVGNGAKRLDPCYDMCRDGFTLLAMGFTGAKALQFKLRYIEAFNTMERKLAGQGRHGAPLNGPKTASDSIRNQPIRDQLRWLDRIARLYGDEVAREGYRETSLPMLPGIQRRLQQGDLFRTERPADKAGE